MSSFPRLLDVLLSHRYSLHTFPKGNLTSPLHELRFFTSIPRACSSIPEHLFRARCPKRDRFKSSRPHLSLSNPMYPTPLFSTTPVTLQQPPGSDLFSLIFFHFFSLPLTSFLFSRTICWPCQYTSLSLACGELRHGPHSTPWRSPFPSRRYLATRSCLLSACIGRQ